MCPEPFEVFPDPFNSPSASLPGPSPVQGSPDPLSIPTDLPVPDVPLGGVMHSDLVSGFFHLVPQASRSVHAQQVRMSLL